MSGAWLDGAPREPFGGQQHGSHQQGQAPSHSGYPLTPSKEKFTDRVTNRVNRVRQFEGPRGVSSRAALAIKYVNYVLVALLGCGLTGLATDGVRFAAGGGTFMLFSVVCVACVGAISTMFYVNLRNEIVERVRHYIFGIILFPGTLLAFVLRALQEWEWVNEGTLGTTLQAALPAIFLATVVLPAIVFVKEMVGIRTLHRSRLDDEEAVHLWTRHDGLQR